jgi:hypothetical protein
MKNELIEKFKSCNKEQLDYELMNYCQEGNLEVVKYLMSSPDLKEKPNMYAENDFAFKRALMGEHLDIVQYFIIECNYEKKETISNLLDVMTGETPGKVNKMFTIREFSETLDEELNSEKTNKKKHKL